MIGRSTSTLAIIVLLSTSILIAPATASRFSVARTGTHSAPRATRTSVPDGSGGSYYEWDDSRDGTADIYLQHFTNTGAVATGWPADGLPVCTAPGNQQGAVLIPDGSGGVIVGWGDMRANWNNVDAYAQRVTSAGTLLWAANGVKVLSNISNSNVGVAADGTGGVLLAWSQMGATDQDIYAIRFTNAGAVAAGWSPTGVLVCGLTADQVNPSVASDGAGGAIVAWEDGRAGAGATDIYAQRLNASGVAQWAANGVQLDAGTFNPFQPVASSDGASGALIFWGDTQGTGSVIGQRVNGSGVAQWTAGGLSMNGGTLSPSSLDSRANGSGAFLAWSSSDGSNVYVMGQSVNGSGVVQWGSGGATFMSLPLLGYPNIGDFVLDGAGGGVIVWEDARNGFQNTDIFAQRVNASGTVQWTANGVSVCGATGSQSGPIVASDGSTGYMVAWLDGRSSGNDVYVQKLNASGAAQFAANGIGLYVDPGTQFATANVADGAGGAIIVWMERRGGQIDIRARRVNSAGTPQWPAAVDVCAAAGNQFFPLAVSDGAGGAIVAWRDERSGAPDIYAQRVTAAGAAQWTANGVAICTATGNQAPTAMIADGAGGAVIAWADDRGGAGGDIYAQRVDGTGASQWGTDGLAVCSAAGAQFSPALASDGAGGAIVAWLDLRSFLTPAIYAQRVNAAGAVQWAADGLSIASATFTSFVTGAVSDGANGAIVLFNQTVIDMTTGNLLGNILGAQRVNGSGVGQWGGAGVTVCDATGACVGDQIVSDGSGGGIIAWSDGRGPIYDIFGQRLNAAGAAQWGVNGMAICNATGWQTLGGLIADGSGGAVLAWTDQRGGVYPDIYAMRVNSAGAAQWAANGVSVCTSARGQYFPPVATDGAGGAIVAWTDNRAANVRSVFAQRVSAGGVPQWTADGVTSTQISLVSSEADARHVQIVWYVSSGAEVAVYRRTSEQDWSRIGTALSDAEGRIAFVDHDIVAPNRYGYRLGIPDPSGEVFGGEVWVDVPAEFSLALDGLLPNPAVGEMTLSFTLASREPARLEVLDVSGRRVASRDVEALGPGRHLLRLDGELRAEGMYFIRLAQGGRTVSTRGVFLK